MASEVDISNLALSFLGEDANVSCINPPDGSVQASLCARFYPIARDSLLELHAWNFATRRATLTALADAAPNQWQYAYALPSDCLKPLAVFDSSAASDLNAYQPDPYPMGTNPQPAGVTPQPYVVETLSTGSKVIFTNQDSAMLRYVRYVTDTTKFSPLFVEALGWMLAARLAGPTLKGQTGRDESKRCMGEANALLGRATVSDANQRRMPTNRIPSALAAR